MPVATPEATHIPEAAVKQSASVKMQSLRQSFASPYLRAAQAYMLISMPTGTSTILGVFQAIPGLLLERDDFRPQLKPNADRKVRQRLFYGQRRRFCAAMRHKIQFPTDPPGL
jgi:hypothetical protein